MRYGYDLNNPLEREMYFKRLVRNLQRANDKNITFEQGFNEVMKEHQEEMEYFLQREKQEKYIREKLEKQIRKELEKEIEKEIENKVEKKLDEIVKEMFK